MATEVGSAYVSILPSAAGFGPAVAAQIVGPTRAAGLAAGSAGGSTLSASLLGAVRGVGPQLAGLLGFATIGVAAFKAAESVESAMNTIARATGATGQELVGLEESFKKIASSSPAGFGVIASALAEVSQRTGLTGDALELLTKQVVTFNRITKDAPINVQTLTQALAAFNVPAKDMSAQLDRLFNISQKTGVPLEQLTQILVTAGPLARQFGLDVDFTAGFLAKLNKAGVDATALLPGMKRLFTQFTEFGGSPKEALANVVGQIDALVKSGQTVAAQDLAKSIFGARGVGLVDAAVSGKLSLQELNKEIDTTGRGILGTAADTGTLAGKLGTLKNQATLAFAAFGTPLLEAATDNLTKLIPITQQLGSAIASLAPALTPALLSWGVFLLTAKTIAPLLTLAVAGVTRLGQAMLNMGVSAQAASVQGLASFANGLQRFATAAPGIAAAATVAALSFDKIGQSATSSVVGVGSLVATGAMIGGVFGGAGAPIGAAAGAIIGLGKAAFSSTNWLDQMTKKMGEFGAEADRLTAKKAATQFIREFGESIIHLGGPIEGTIKSLRTLAETSPAAAQRVVAGLRAIRDESGKPLFDEAAFAKFEAAVDKGAAAFTRHSKNAAEASATNQEFTQTLTNIGPTAEAAAQAVQAAVDSLASSVASGLPTASGLIDDAAEAFGRFGLAIDPAALSQRFAEALTNEMAFFDNFKTIAEAGFGNIAAVIAQKGPEVGGSLAQQLADAIRNGEPQVVASLNEQAQAFQTNGDQINAYIRDVLGPQLYGSNVDATALAAAGITVTAPQVGAAALAGAQGASNQWTAGLGGIPGNTGSAVASAGPNVTASADEIARLQAFGGGQQIGLSLVDGIASGIAHGQYRGTAQDAMSRLISAIISAAKSAAGIASPSKVFAEMGEFMTAGLAEGLDDGVPEVVRAAERVVAAAALEHGRGIPTFLGGTHTPGTGLGPITVNVHGVADPALARAAGEQAGRGIMDALTRRNLHVAAVVG